MTGVLMSECIGFWRRTLLIEADGSRDTGTDVGWLQGITAYIDTRGFAGRLGQHEDVFEWSRLIDIQPPGPFPDAGRMRWETDTLVEVGLHSDYVEHWVRDDGAFSPCWALFVRSGDGDDALLLRVGNLFGWADRTGVMQGVVGGPEWTVLGPCMSGENLEANGVRWKVEQSEGNVDL
jgi:hypothetical protein